MSGAENAVNGVPAAGRMPADGNQASPSLPPDAVQLDKLMVDILSGQVVNNSDGRNDDAAEARPG